VTGSGNSYFEKPPPEAPVFFFVVSQIPTDLTLLGFLFIFKIVLLVGLQLELHAPNSSRHATEKTHEINVKVIYLFTGLLRGLRSDTMLKLCLRRVLRPVGQNSPSRRLGTREPREPLTSATRAKDFIYRLQPAERTCLLRQLQSFESVALTQGETRNPCVFYFITFIKCITFITFIKYISFYSFYLFL